MQMYVAVEYNDDDKINDWGMPATTPKKAWKNVTGIFDKNSTKIHPILTTVTFPIGVTNENQSN